MRFDYPISLERDLTDGKDWGWVVTFPDLPEAITSGCTLDEATRNAIDCLETAVAWRIKDREDIPPPSAADGRPTVQPGSLIAAKAALYLTLRAAGLRPADLARRMGVPDSVVVNRLLNPRHASKPDQLDAAFAALGKRLAIAVVEACPRADLRSDPGDAT